MHFFRPNLVQRSQHPRGDLNFRRQRPVHRAFVGDFQELEPLFVRNRPGQLDVALDSIEHALFRFTLAAIDGVNFRVP